MIENSENKKDVQKARKNYIRPQLEQVMLLPEQAVLSAGCKVSSEDAYEAQLQNYVCSSNTCVGQGT